MGELPFRKGIQGRAIRVYRLVGFVIKKAGGRISAAHSCV
jgi:hypothetical protein